MRGRWSEVIQLMKFSPEIRKAVYTTNAIESLNYTLMGSKIMRILLVLTEVVLKLKFPSNSN